MSANTICKKTSSYQIVRLYLCSLKVTFLPFFVVLFCFVLRMALTFFKLLALNEERTKLHSLQVWPRRWLFLTNMIGFSVFLRFLKHVHVAWSGNSRYLRDAHVRKPPQMLKNHSAWRKTNTHTHTQKVDALCVYRHKGTLLITCYLLIFCFALIPFSYFLKIWYW